RRFRFKNNHGQRRDFRLSKYEPDISVVRAVTVNSTNVPFINRNDEVSIEIEVDPGQAVDVEILDHPMGARRTWSMEMAYNAGVLVRRALSEFQDNTLSRHPSWLRVATKLTKKLRVTGK